FPLSVYRGLRPQIFLGEPETPHLSITQRTMTDKPTYCNTTTHFTVIPGPNARRPNGISISTFTAKRLNSTADPTHSWPNGTLSQVTCIYILLISVVFPGNIDIMNSDTENDNQTTKAMLCKS